MYFEATKGQILGEFYQVGELLGEGVHSSVFEAIDLRDGTQVALKISTTDHCSLSSAKAEEQILKKFESQRIVKIYSSFNMGQHYVLVLERLGYSLKDVLQRNNKGFPVEFVRDFSRQLCQALLEIHSESITHTDLKPDNILLVTNEFIKTSDGLKLPASTAIKLADFGLATYDTNAHGNLINAASYRGPEVLLQLGWDKSSDMWSLGCVLTQLYTGDTLFSASSDFTQLALQEKVVGPIPEWIPREVKPKFLIYFEGGKITKARDLTDREHRNQVRQFRYLEQIIDAKDKEFRKLIYAMLNFSPARRISPKDAIVHEFHISTQIENPQDI